MQTHERIPGDSTRGACMRVTGGSHPACLHQSNVVHPALHILTSAQRRRLGRCSLADSMPGICRCCWLATTAHIFGQKCRVAAQCGFDEMHYASTSDRALQPVLSPVQVAEQAMLGLGVCTCCARVCMCGSMPLPLAGEHLARKSRCHATRQSSSGAAADTLTMLEDAMRMRRGVPMVACWPQPRLLAGCCLR
jgi:hypothetical protein